VAPDCRPPPRRPPPRPTAPVISLRQVRPSPFAPREMDHPFRTPPLARVSGTSSMKPARTWPAAGLRTRTTSIVLARSPALPPAREPRPDDARWAPVPPQGTIDVVRVGGPAGVVTVCRSWSLATATTSLQPRSVR
jgi:hypothetical protein